MNARTNVDNKEWKQLARKQKRGIATWNERRRKRKKGQERVWANERKKQKIKKAGQI